MGKLAIKRGSIFKQIDKTVAAVQRELPGTSRDEIIGNISKYAIEHGNSAIDLIARRQSLLRRASVDRNARVERQRLEKQLSKKRISPDEMKLLKNMDGVKRQAAELQQQIDEKIKGMKPRAGADKVLRVLNMPNRTMRVLMTVGDNPALGQGSRAVLAMPIKSTRRLAQSIRAVFDPAYTEKVSNSIDQRPNAPYYGQPGIATHYTGVVKAHEEFYADELIDKIPGLRKIKNATERGYATFLRLVRADFFDMMADGFAKGGEPTLEEAEILAHAVGVFTGRGSLGKLEGISEELNATMFAPRYFASKIQYALLQPLYGGNARTRIAIGKVYAKQIMSLGAILTMASYAGAKVELDPRSADFGKIVVGNTHIDLMGGALRPMMFAARSIMGQKKTGSGHIVDIRGDKVPYGGANWWDTLGQEARYNLSPQLGIVADMLTGKTAVGKPVTAKDEIVSHTVPFFLQDSYEAMKEHGPVPGTALAILNYLGLRMNTYETGQNRGKPRP